MEWEHKALNKQKNLSIAFEMPRLNSCSFIASIKDPDSNWRVNLKF